MKTLRQRLHNTTTANLWLLAGLLVALLPHLLRIPLIISAAASVLLGWRLGYELHYLRLPPRLWRWLLALLAAIIIYSSFHSLVGRQAGVALLVLMLGLKLLEMNGPRDFSVTCYLGFFLISTVFLFTQSILTGLFMLLATTLLLTALVAQYRGTEYHDTQHISESMNLRKAALIVAQALPLTVLLFVLFPRIPGPLWQLPNDRSGAKTGISDSMSPGMISQLSNDNSVAFRVRFASEPPPPAQLYWRGPVLTVFDGRTWFNPDHKKPWSKVSTRSRYQALNAAISYTVTLEPHQQRWLFALDLPAMLPADSILSPDYEIIARHNVEQLRRYDMQSYPYYALAQTEAPPERPYLQLPTGVGPQARVLARAMLAQAGSKAAMVKRVLQYFRQQPFYYTRQPPLLLGDPIDEFLFNIRRGYCEHYAASFVFLMRAAGIPARVVTGYRGGEMNPLSDYFIVRQSDAHAWTEVWLAGKGWLRVDPTTVIPVSRIENQLDRLRIAPDGISNVSLSWAHQAWRQLGFNWDLVNRAWNQWIINYNNRRQQDFLQKIMARFGFADIDWQTMILTMLLSLFAILAGYAWWLLRRSEMKLRKDPVQRYYTNYCHKLDRSGLARQVAEGAWDFAQRAQQRFPEHSKAIVEIAGLYNRLRYAPWPRKEDVHRLQKAVRCFPNRIKYPQALQE